MSATGGDQDESRVRHERGKTLKGIFIITLALCLGACASQPEKVVTADQPAGDSTERTQPSSVSSTGSSDRVYLDDYDRVPFQTPPRNRGVRVLGSKKG